MNFQIIKNKSLKCELTSVTINGTIWFKAFPVAEALGYKNASKSINDHVRDKHKAKVGSLVKNNESLFSQKGIKPATLLISEPGLYSLIMKSKLKSAEKFQDWVYEDVLPTIRKTGAYQMKYPVKQKLAFKIENEFDLHAKVVNFLKNQYPDSVFIATLGELQDTVSKRIKSSQMGYIGGAPDLLILNPHIKFNGFAIEFKTPTGKGIVSAKQSTFLKKFKRLCNYKTLVTNDYDKSIIEIIEYFRGVRICCEYCDGKFKTNKTLTSHEKHFHRHN